jgi:hypothetical protein
MEQEFSERLARGCRTSESSVNYVAHRQRLGLLRDGILPAAFVTALHCVSHFAGCRSFGDTLDFFRGSSFTEDQYT